MLDTGTDTTRLTIFVAVKRQSIRISGRKSINNINFLLIFPPYATNL